MESEITEISYSEHKLFNSTQNNSGLLRFRSAPSSFLANWDGKSEKNEDDETLRFNSSKATINGTNALNSKLIPPQYPRINSSTRSGSINGSYRAQNLDLMRQISTPAELFSPFPAQNGFGSIKNAGSYGFSNGQVEFSSPMPSTLGILSRISEVENENIEMNITHDRKFGDGYREPSIYGSGLPFSSWNHSTKFGDNLTGVLKTEMDCNDETVISDIPIQGGRPRNRPNTMDKFLHLQDAVPCKLRAKRGCATHPRSIAERVRRTRISERMRKLQELVPNMEKQTNTSDMLDLAVDYIKELQKQYKSLSDIRSKCKCSAMQKHVSDQKY